MDKKLRFTQAAIMRRLAESDKKPTIPKYAYRGQDSKLPSLSTVDDTGIATVKATKMYTGDKMLGISQLHKSNAIPVFRQEDIIDIAKMRR
jgi:hypothetical protein